MRKTVKKLIQDFDIKDIVCHLCSGRCGLQDPETMPSRCVVIGAGAGRTSLAIARATGGTRPDVSERAFVSQCAII